MESFINAVKDTVQKFNKLQQPIRIVSHYDCDGISAAAIMVSVLKRKKIKFVLSTAKQLDSKLLRELKREKYDIIFFIDMGSGYLKSIENELNNKTIFIFDHHSPDTFKTKNIVHLNPHLFGVDGSKEISGAGVVYLFAKYLDAKNIDLAYLAIIGAIGDIQENKGFNGLNKLILDDAVASKKLEIKEGLCMFGMQTKPIHKVLEYSTNLYIPDVTGNEEGAKRFLEEIGIEFKKDGKYKKLIHLNNDEMKKLVTAIIIRRLGSEEKPDDVLGPIYLLVDEEEECPTRDLKEFSTLLNATGRLRKSGIGIGVCLGDKKIKKEAIELLMDYKKEIIKALEWYYRNRKTGKIIEKDYYVVINAEHHIRDTLIGTLTSIISKSNIYREGTVIVSMAYTLDGNIKVSLRISGFKKTKVDLKNLIKLVVDQVGGIAGGHFFAAGALIPQKKENDFINVLSEKLSILDKRKFY